jgi:KipI family sensor histidine kinase inhibitor
VLAEVADTAAAHSLAAHARSVGLVATEVVPGACTVLFDGLAEPGRLADDLAGWSPGPAGPPGPLVEVPVTYDGADLAAVAEQWGTDEAGVVARHTATELVSAFCGFSPGFAYLAGQPSPVRRLASPRARVPAGSVALADRWCGVYPTASPGGWLLVGRTDLRVWDPTRPDPALLAPGTRVRFVAT